MARAFEDHCWQDVIGDDLREIYASYERDIFVGEKPAVLAIDLYNNAYRGGNVPVLEANRENAGSCGENAWAAIEPTKLVLAAARAAGVPVIYTTRYVDTNGVNSTNRLRAAVASGQYCKERWAFAIWRTKIGSSTCVAASSQ